MPTYAIGDVQGCFEELKQLLNAFGFSATNDRLWFVGDLVNRGPKSLEMLRFARSLGGRAVTVLGNHDLHLVSHFEGFAKLRGDDTFHDVLAADDARELVDWLRTRPLMHVEAGHAMVHAGLPPQWSIDKGIALASEVQAALGGPGYRDFLAHMYGSAPDTWSDALGGWDRLRVIVNAMTRLRFCSSEGRMDLQAKGIEPPAGTRPWYEYRPRDESIVCGHWSALGLKITDSVALLDTGCVWGGKLTALRLEDRALYQVPCAGYHSPGGDS